MITAVSIIHSRETPKIYCIKELATTNYCDATELCVIIRKDEDEIKINNNCISGESVKEPADICAKGAPLSFTGTWHICHFEHKTKE